MNPPVRLLAGFQDAFDGMTPQFILAAPGYDVWIAATPVTEPLYRFHEPDRGKRAAFAWRGAKHCQTILGRPLPDWARYPAGVIYMLGGQGIDVDGVNAVLVADEAAGPRLHYGLGLAVAALWHDLNGKAYSAETLHPLMDRVRRDYAGVAGSR